VSIKLNATLAVNIMWDNPFDRSKYIFENMWDISNQTIHSHHCTTYIKL